ncbi:hypothetical protein MMC10_001500 [Thelotrema lepadinum]|nr:hypothetical protein [Thelotrema lepadinum]
MAHAPTMASTITIDRSYFDTLLRRAHTHYDDGSATVFLAKSEHDSLIQVSKEYEALKDALQEGGCATEMIAVQFSDLDDAMTDPHDGLVAPSTLGYFATAPQQLFQKPGNNGNQSLSPAVYLLNEASQENAYSKRHSTVNRPGHDLKTHRPVASWVDAIKNVEAGKLSSSISFGSFDHSDAESSVGWQTAGTDMTSRPVPVKRSLRLQRLPDEVTYKDIVGLMRGGALLDVSLQSRGKSAWVSFVDPAAAVSFLKYAQYEVIRLHGQKIDVSLASRPYRASSNVMRQIEVSGATRNLVICQIGQDLNEEGIREQLDHIHNLHVIEVTFSDGAAIISLNAVGVALYARTCLRSRATYKKCKIDFYPDGCAQPLPTQYIKASTSAVERPPLKTTQSLSSRFHSLENRFQLLEMEDTENDSEETATAGMMSQESQSSGGVPLNT